MLTRAGATSAPGADPSADSLPARVAGQIVADEAEPAPEQARRRQRALTGGLWSAAAQLLPAAGTAALSVAAGRYLGSAQLGQQSLIAYVNAAASGVIVISLNTALLQIGGKAQGASDGRVAALVRWAVGAHLAGGLVILAAMAGAGLLDGRNHSAWLVIGGVAVLDAAADGLAVRLILIEGWGPIGRLRLIFQLLGPPLGLAFLFTGFGITGLFLGDGIAALGLLVTVVRRYRSTSGVPVVPGDDATARAGLRPPLPVARTAGLFALEAAIGQVVTKRVEFVVLALFATDFAIGQYSVAFMIVSLISAIPSGIAVAAMPSIAAAAGRGETQRAEHHLRLALRIGTIVMIPVVALVAALGPEAVLLVYGTAYSSAGKLTALASLMLLTSVATGLCTQYWSGLGRIGIVIVTGAIAGIVDLGAAFAAVPPWSALGAVLANLLGQLVLAGGLLLVTVHRTGPIGWRLDGLARTVIAAACGAVAVSAVRLAVDAWVPLGPEWRSACTLAAGGVIGLAVVAVAALRLGLFDAAERDWLTPILPGRLRPVVARLSRES